MRSGQIVVKSLLYVYSLIMEEPKLSEKERQLLASLYEMDVYNLALKPILQRWGNGIAKQSAQQATDWDMIMRNRGMLELIRQLNLFLKRTNEKEKKSGQVKSK